MQHAAAQTRVDFAASIGDAIHIGAFQSGESGVEPDWRLADAMDGDVVGQHPLQTMFQSRHCRHFHMPYRSFQYVRRHVDMAYLMAGVHAGVGATGDHQAKRF